MARVLYFAQLRERVGVASEEVALPVTVKTGKDLIAWLSVRHPALADAVDEMRLRMALDQEIAPLGAPLGNAQEIALFPPMTGG